MAHTVSVDMDKCVGCGICARICPTGTLQIDKESKKAYTTTVTCDNAWGCLFVCPAKALSITEVRQ